MQISLYLFLVGECGLSPCVVPPDIDTADAAEQARWLAFVTSRHE